MSFPGGGMPSPEYLAALNGAMSPRLPAPAMSVDPRMAPPPPAPPPEVSPAPMVDTGPLYPSPSYADAGPPPDAPPYRPDAAPAPVAPPPNAAPPPPAPMLRQVSAGGVIKAHEVDVRGPSLHAAQVDANAANLDAIHEIRQRNEQMAQAEYEITAGHVQKAAAREDAIVATQAKREQDMLARQADFDQSVKAFSGHSVDPGRFWANASTGTKIAAVLSSAFGGFAQGVRGGDNPGITAINTMIDRDIRAQEFAYQVARDKANAKQTAFSMAMQRYGNEDAARASARAAALETVNAQLSQQAAMWKGTEAGNHALVALAKQKEAQAQQIAQGVRFVQATAAGPTFVDKNGLRYSAQEAKAIAGEGRKQGFELQKQAEGAELKAAGDIAVERAKGGAKDDKDLGVETRAISSQLQQAGVPQARQAAETALAALNKSPGGMGEAAFRATSPDAVGHAVSSHDANAREQAYSKFSNAAVKAIMGNATEAERARMVEDLGRASDPESRKRAIANVLKDLEAIEKNAQAGASPSAQAAFRERRDEAEGGQPLAPVGAKPR